MAADTLICNVLKAASDRVATLEPLYQMTPEGQYRRISNSSVEYPDLGRIVWFDPPRLQEGGFWRVEITDCSTYHKAEPNTEAFMVLHGSQEALSEVLDLQHLGDEDDIRIQVTGDGILLQQAPLNPLYLLIGRDRFVGPVHLIHTGSQRWRLDSSTVEAPLTCFEGDESGLFSLEAGRARRLIAVASRHWRRSGQTDWNTDDIKVLVRTLKDIRRADPEFARSQKVTDKAIEHVGYLLANGMASDRKLLEQRLNRTKRFFTLISQNFHAGEEVVDSLLSLPRVRAELEERRVALEEDLRRDIIDRVNMEIAAAHQQLADLRNEHTSSLADLETIKSEIHAQTQRLDDVVDSFERRLAERVTAIAADPQRFLADVTLLRVALGVDSGKSLPNIMTNNNTAVAPEPDSLVFNEPRQLDMALDLSFQAAELPLTLWRLLKGALLIGSVPALAGGRSTDALQTFARCTVGGRVLRVAASSGIFSPIDLLDQPVVNDTGMPRLAQALRKASQVNSLTLVILENANVIPLDTILLPLLRSQRMGGGPLSQNVCVAVTLSQGVARLPLPAGTWEYLVLVELTSLANARGSTVHPDRRPLPLRPSEISSASWQEIRESASGGAVARCAEILTSLQDSLALDLGVRDHALRLFASLQSCGCDEMEALETVLSGVVAPSLPNSTDALPGIFSDYGLSTDRIRAMIATTHSLNA